jgi:hypothetical protein
MLKTKSSKTMNGVQAFWNGKPFSIGEYDSELVSGRRVVVIAAFKSMSKTGRMIQISFLDVEVNQRKIDGDIPNGQGCSRPQCGSFDICYVQAFPLHIMHIDNSLNDYKLEDMPKLTMNQFLILVNQSKSPVRFGEFGDPTSIKYEIVEKIKKASNGHTAYTHQWRTCDQRFKDVCMASVEGELDYQLAKSMGWKTFSIGLSPIKGERIMCLNESQDMNCEYCKLCEGSNAKVSVVITPHGKKKKLFTILN